MPKTWFWLRRIHGSWVADETHQTSVKSPSTFKHLSLLCFKAWVPSQKKLVSSVCTYEMTACFTSAFAVNHLPSTYSLRGPSLDGNHCVPYWHLKLRLVTDIRLGGCGPPILQSRCRISIHLVGPLEKHLPAKRFATDANVKQGVAFWSQSLDTGLFYAGMERW